MKILLSFWILIPLLLTNSVYGQNRTILNISIFSDKNANLPSEQIIKSYALKRYQNPPDRNGRSWMEPDYDENNSWVDPILYPDTCIDYWSIIPSNPNKYYLYDAVAKCIWGSDTLEYSAVAIRHKFYLLRWNG